MVGWHSRCSVYRLLVGRRSWLPGRGWRYDSLSTHREGVGGGRMAVPAQRRESASASWVIYCYWSNYATVECIFMRLIIIYDKAPSRTTIGSSLTTGNNGSNNWRGEIFLSSGGKSSEISNQRRVEFSSSSSSFYQLEFILNYRRIRTSLSLHLLILNNIIFLNKRRFLRFI